MKLYIDPQPNEGGSYPNPKCQPFPGCIELTEEQSQTFLDYNGFVTIKDGAVTPNTEAWDCLLYTSRCV